MDRLKHIIAHLTLAAAISLGVAHPTAAATPTTKFIVPAGVLRAGQTVSIDVHLDSGGQLINAFNLSFKYSPVYLEPLMISRAEKIWTLWPEEPRADPTSGTISLAGGRPNGLVAIDAPVATIAFRILAGGQTQLVLDQAASGVYLNDGRGTRLETAAAPSEIFLADALVPTITLDLSTTPVPDTWSSTHSIHVRWAADPSLQYSYALSTDSQMIPDDTSDQPVGRVDYADQADGVYYWSIKSRTDGGLWSRVSQYRFLLDAQPPRPFSIVVIDPAAVGGRRSIGWNATDDTSGVAGSTLLVNGRTVGAVMSPLILRSEWRGKTLTIIARDAAGNEQQSSWVDPGSGSRAWWYAAFGLAAALFLMWLFRSRRRQTPSTTSP